MDKRTAFLNQIVSDPHDDAPRLALAAWLEEHGDPNFAKYIRARWLCEQYGAVMKEYVRVPASLLQNTRALAKYLDVSYRYACSLKPKPTTKKTTAKKGKAARRQRGALSQKSPEW